MDTPHHPDAKDAALELRYGTAAIPAVGPWNEIIAGLMTHRSVRGYLPTALPPGTLETLVAAAQSAATSSNLQTWSVVAVTDPEKKAALAKLSNNQKHMEECPLLMVWLADVSRNRRMAEQEGAPLASLPYLETFLVAAIDAALAAQNAAVAAESLGLSTVYIGAMRNNPERVAEVLRLPSGAMAVFGLCIGYAKPEAASEVKPRLAQAAILHRETYDASRERELRAAYDAELAGYSKRHEMAQYTWTERVIGRMSKVSALSGRDRLKTALNALGFELR